MAFFTWPPLSVGAAGLATEAQQIIQTALLTTIDADTSALAGTVSGSELQVDVVTSALPAGAATQATLSALEVKAATETTLAALEVKAATETTLSALNSKVTAVNTGNVTVTSSALPAGASTEATLAALNAKVTAVNTNSVTVASSALPTGAATEATLAALAAEDFATETTLAAINTKTPALGQAVMASSVPVVIASNQSSVPVTQSGKSVVTTHRRDYSISSVTTAAWSQLVASLGSAVTEIEIFDSSGQTLELGIGAAAAETRLILVFPGGNGRVPVAIASGARVSLRAVSATADVGEIDINFYA